MGRFIIKNISNKITISSILYSLYSLTGKDSLNSFCKNINNFCKDLVEIIREPLTIAEQTNQIVMYKEQSISRKYEDFRIFCSDLKDLIKDNNKKKKRHEIKELTNGIFAKVDSTSGKVYFFIQEYSTDKKISAKILRQLPQNSIDDLLPIFKKFIETEKTNKIFERSL